MLLISNDERIEIECYLDDFLSFITKTDIKCCYFDKNNNDFVVELKEPFNIDIMNELSNFFSIDFSFIHRQLFKAICFKPHELKNYLCYIDDNKIYIVCNWDGRILQEDWSAEELIDTTILKNFDYKNFICLSAFHLVRLKNHQIECDNETWSEIIKYGEDRTPI